MTAARNAKPAKAPARKPRPKVEKIHLHDMHDAPRTRTITSGVVTTHTGQLRAPLLEFIEGSEVIVGCVAWVTDRDIIEALSRRPIALVVQKERWWKKTDSRGMALAARYATLRGGISASSLPGPIAMKKQGRKMVPNEVELAPIACFGYGAGSQYQPLMHHKFIVRCEMVRGLLVAQQVWTGSFNFSNNANDSFENAVVIDDPMIAAAYLDEFALTADLSESMNWRFTSPSPRGVGAVFVPPIGPTTTSHRKRRRPAAAVKAKPVKKSPAKKKVPLKKAPVRRKAA